MPDLTKIDFTTAQVLPGNIVIDLDPLPEQIGSLFVPDTARVQRVTDISHTGIIVAVGYGEFWRTEDGKTKHYCGLTERDFRVGDRVVFRMLMSDLNQKRIITDVRRIDAVVEDQKA